MKRTTEEAKQSLEVRKETKKILTSKIDGNQDKRAAEPNLSKTEIGEVFEYMKMKKKSEETEILEVEQEKKKLKKTNKIGDNQYKRTEGFNLSIDPLINTLEDSLNYFGLFTLLKEFQKRLADVRMNQSSREEHEQSLRTAVERMVDLDRIIQLDYVDNAGRLKGTVSRKLHSALNTTRTALKTLTEVFLNDIDTDYRYEYFTKLEISLLVNKNELQNRINDMSYKVREISGKKRLMIIGNIRKFLTASQKSIKSYIERSEDDFKKYRDCALFHLKKCTESYKKLEMGYELLEKECRDKTEKDVKSVIIKIAEQTLRESEILKALESVAGRSLRGNFEFFTTDKSMDGYFILPFIHYVNVLLMCNVALRKRRKNSCSLIHSASILHLKDDPVRILFAYAYYLACHLRDKKRCKKDVETTTGSKAFGMSAEEFVIEAFDEALKEISKVLKNDFRVDAYDEDESNRMQFKEQLPQSEEMIVDTREQAENDKIDDSHDKKPAEPKLSNDPLVNTLEDWLNYFGMSTLLEELQKSLDDVKRNKRSKREHEQCLHAAEKKIELLHIIFQPDQVNNRRISDLEVAVAQRFQSALRATRTVLKLLTEVVLKDNGYRYEYFAELEISSTVNEYKIEHRVNEVLCKVNETSEMKRLRAALKEIVTRRQRRLNSNGGIFSMDWNGRNLTSSVRKGFLQELESDRKKYENEVEENITSLIVKMAEHSL